MPEIKRSFILFVFLLSLAGIVFSQGRQQKIIGDQSARSLTTFDVFPLVSNVHVTYQFAREWYYVWDPVRPVAFDSGTVEYTVVDSSFTDATTITWQVLEHAELFSWSNAWGGYDTSFSSMISLIESTTGAHELRCTSLVWNFPLGPVPVFRYADTSDVLLTFSWGNCGSAVSALFSGDSGLLKRETYYCAEECGGFFCSDLATSAFLLSRTVTDIHANSDMPTLYRLDQNYPNPFNPATVIRYQLPVKSYVSLKVYDLLGQETAVLADGERPAGVYSVEFAADHLPSGLYFYRLQTDGFVETKKLILMR